jgi:hypothetical protein
MFCECGEELFYVDRYGIECMSCHKRKEFDFIEFEKSEEF